MRKGEKGILIAIAVIVLAFGAINVHRHNLETEPDKGIPFYSTASPDVQDKGAELYRRLSCRDCHTLWGVRNAMQAVPAPSLDGIGSLKEEQWLYAYLSAENPQQIIPSRLRDEYKMPSYAFLPEAERRLLANYLSSLKAEAWYLEEVKKSEYEKLKGKEYPAVQEVVNE